MSDYRRVTRLCQPDQLQPELRRALRDYAGQLKLADFDTDIVMGCETRSERIETGRLASLLEGDPDQVHYTAVLLTSQSLIWARSGDKSETVVASTQLKGLGVAVRIEPKRNKIVLELNGFFGNARQHLNGALVFSAEPAAEKFCGEVMSAVQYLNPRPKPKRRRIFGIGAGD
jgi:hypothetical protein